MSRFNGKLLAAFGAALLMLGLFGGCGWVSADTVAADGQIIGVAVYSYTDDEVNMFRQYYQNYIESNFPVTFVYSEAIRSAEDEQNFLRQAKAAGAEGIISFITYDLPAAVELASQNEMYFMLGSGTISEEDFAAVAAEPYFLGVIGPDRQDEYQTGYAMAVHFAGQAAEEPNFVIVAGGAAIGNAMHRYRAEGMLQALADVYGWDYEQPLTEILQSTEPRQLNEHVYYYPGYVRGEQFLSDFGKLLTDGQIDVALDTMMASDFLPAIAQAEKAGGRDILVGAVDCFSEGNFAAFCQEGSLDYLAGKYASMIGPAFAAMFNALQGDVDFMREGGQAFRLHQGFWLAEDAAAFAELYSYTQGVYVNAYSADDLRRVIRAYTPAAEFADLQALAEASDVESVKARIAGE